MKYVDNLHVPDLSQSWITQYKRFRMGRLKHQYWLTNRKNSTEFIIDPYDYFILQNLNAGPTTIFGSAGYYLEEVVPDLHVVEMHPVVKTFYPKAIIVSDRKDIKNHVPKSANFIVTNNRGDHWMKDVNELNSNIKSYVDCLQPNGLLFYSFRDTQMLPLNRLVVDMEEYYRLWAVSLQEQFGLVLCWSDINFKKQIANKQGIYPSHENPDTTNGNLKFIFCLRGTKTINT